MDDNGNEETDTKSYELTVFRPFQIENMYPAYGGNDGYDYGDGAYHVPYVKTSEPYDRVEWYIGSKRHTSQGDGKKTSASPTFYLTSDCIKGIKYEVTAVA